MDKNRQHGDGETDLWTDEQKWTDKKRQRERQTDRNRQRDREVGRYKNSLTNRSKANLKTEIHRREEE